MMGKSNIFIALIALWAVIVGFAPSMSNEDVIKKISDAFGSGNSSELAKYLNPTVELEILSEENIYSKAQTELMLKNFFSRHKPRSFRVNHQGSKGASSFAIGVLEAETGSFRVSIFLKTDNNNLLIHQLRIESGEDGIRR